MRYGDRKTRAPGGGGFIRQAALGTGTLAAIALFAWVIHGTCSIGSFKFLGKLACGDQFKAGSFRSAFTGHNDDTHILSEVAYHTAQNAALQHLEAYPAKWATPELWLLMGPFQNCPMRQRIGSVVDGGKWICDVPVALKAAAREHGGKDCYVYSLGSAGSTSFEEAVYKIDPSCSIHTFDHTLDEELTKKVSAVPGMTFHPKGIASNAQLATSGAQFTSISKSMADLGIPWLDILKIDIEGHEWSSFLEMLEGGLPMPFTQILIEIHTHPSNIPAGATAEDVLRRFFTGMHAAGFRVFSVEYNALVTTPPNICWEYSFIKVDSFGYPVRQL